jgi:hypothetical protein
MSSVRRETVGFGCPAVGSPHHMVVDIPPKRDGSVLVVEHFGVQAVRDGAPESIDRVELPRPIWAAIADTLRKTFNERLKEKDLATGKWVPGENKVDRLLGKELCVLAWAVEKVHEDLVPAAITNWLGLKPEERWWLFTVTAAATGGLEDGNIGWRKALRYALTENPVQVDEKRKRGRGRRGQSGALSLFPTVEEKA